MTGPRLPHARATVTLTSGDDHPTTPCRLNFMPWDVMVDHKPGTQQHEAAKRDAAAMCGRCPVTSCAFRIGGRRAA